MRLAYIIISILILHSCQQQEKPTTAQPVTNDSIKFFQVSEYIKSQLQNISTTPYYIYKTTESNGKKDSVATTIDDLTLLAKHFMSPDLNDKSVKPYFTESVFFDQTTKTFSINYSTANKELNLQNIDVVLKEDGKTVKRIFIRKFFNYQDSSAIEQLSWKPNESFQINRLVQHADKKEISTQTSVVWNEKDK